MPRSSGFGDALGFRKSIVNLVKRARSRLQHRKIALPWMLIVPFVLQVVPVVSYVGYVSYRNGQKSVEDLTQQLMDKTSDRVQDKLEHYFSAPELASQQLADAVARGDLKLDLDRVDPARDRYLWQQMQLFNNFTWISLGSEAGDAMGLWRPQPGEPLQISMSNRSTQYFGQYHATNAAGERTQRLKIEQPAYDPRPRPWYKSAIGQSQTVWNKVYAGFTPGTIFVAASRALYDPEGNFVGVSGIDLSLSSLQTFLQENRVSQAGDVFLMDRSGQLVASSTDELPFRWPKDQKPEQIRATESRIPIIRDTTQHLQQQFGDLQQLQSQKPLQLAIKGETHFVQVASFRQGDNLDWLVVTVIPESAVMAKINNNNQFTILICVIASVIIIILNSIINRWLTQPITHLSQASQAIAQGNFNYPIRSPRVQELFTLVHSFRQMSQEIQQSRQQLEDYSRSLEAMVRDRTEALESEVSRRAMAESALVQANEELQRLAFLDGLTQIANRRCFDQQLQSSWQWLKREQQPLSLILCDVDHFKRYNDHYGHQAGDDCLVQVAQAIAVVVKRPGDLAARYGGEEFAILLPNTPLEGAIEVASLIRDRLQTQKLIHAASEVSPYVTLSLGIATVIPQDGLVPGELLATADQALYRAKAQGRNQFATASLVAASVAEAEVAPVTEELVVNGNHI
jgi:diguanylate cyclase (GGDEF)-like protein